MRLTIKNQEARRLAGELARLTGATMTGAVTVALRERLARVQAGQTAATKKASFEELMELSRRSGEFFGGTNGPGSTDHGDWLYDEDGLPRGNGDFTLTDIEVVDISQYADVARKADGEQRWGEAPREKDA